MKNIKPYVSAYILILIGLIVINIIFILATNRKVKEYYDLTVSHLQIERNVNDLEGRVLRMIDIGVRGYALSKDSMMLVPFYVGIDSMNLVFANLDTELAKYDFNQQKLATVEKSIRGYAEQMDTLRRLVDQDKMERFREIFVTDPGYPVWIEYNDFRTELNDYLVTQRAYFQAELDRFQQIITFIQLSSLVLAGIVFIKMYTDVRTYTTSRERLLKELRESEQALEVQKDQLEVTVADRTHELHEKNLELSEAYEKLKATQIQLIQSEKRNSTSSLISGVAHELNNPLNYIQGGMMILEDYFLKRQDMDESDLQTAIDTIKEGISRSTGIVKSLNSFTSGEDDQMVFCDIHRIIEDLLLFESQKMKDIDLDKKFGEIEPLPVRKGAITLLLKTILENAVDETLKSEDKYIRIRTETVNDGKQPRVLICFFNTGAQISESIANRIFDPFFSTKGPGQGQGLGLSVALSIAHLHKGTIHFSNRENGVEFIVTIPILSDDASI